MLDFDSIHHEIFFFITISWSPTQLLPVGPVDIVSDKTSGTYVFNKYL